MKLLQKIRGMFRPQRQPVNAAGDELRRRDDEPEPVPSEAYMSQTRD